MPQSADIEFSDITTLQVEITDNIAHIQLSRPEQLNSMNPAFWQELPQVVSRIDEYSAARVIVISSQGKHFSAGMDLSVFQSMVKDFSGEPARRAERFRRMVLELQDTFNALETIRIPVLVAVQGGAIGGAVDMLSACCSRYCTEDAFFLYQRNGNWHDRRCWYFTAAPAYYAAWSRARVGLHWAQFKRSGSTRLRFC
jgi:enoyl-CoA hydratase